MHRFCPRLRFSLRTLFVLVTALSVSLGYSFNWIRERREARIWLSSDDHGHVIDGNSGNPFGDDPDLHPAPWNIRILGEIGVCHIFYYGSDSDEKFARFKKLFPEADVRIVR